MHKGDQVTVVQLTGGLGNQLFQYAFARSLSQRNNSTLLLDSSQVAKRADRNNPRAFKLHEFQVSAPIVPWMNGLSNAFDWSGRRYALNKPPFSFLRRRAFVLSKLSEKSFSFSQTALETLGNVYVTTYWQSPKYFEMIRDIIVAEIQPRKIDSPIHANLATTIAATECPVSVAFRRGDFVNHPHHSKFHGTCSLTYYSQAFDNLKRLGFSPHLFVFSDEIEWVKSNIKFPFKHTFMDQEYDRARYDYLDLWLMSKCRHHIIANSTFSWWGAWLSREEGKRVIAPKKWFNDETIDTSDLIPKTWIRI